MERSCSNWPHGPKFELLSPILLLLDREESQFPENLAQGINRTSAKRSNAIAMRKKGKNIQKFYGNILSDIMGPNMNWYLHFYACWI